MNRENKYKIAVWVLSSIIIILGVVIFAVTRPKKIIRPQAVSLKGKIAIVLDDWGYNLNNQPLIEGIKVPLTASVLPALSFSRKAAELLHNHGWEIILHLPMEPQEKYRLEKNTIMVGMDEAGIRGILDKDLESVPHVTGVSNHMGSRATSDARTMQAVFGELKKKHLYFLDSFVSGQSVCSGLARKMGLAFAQRDVFLDNQEETGYIRAQIYKLKLKARAKGSAIGIGHDRKITLEVLKEVIPEMEKEGYKFVLLSELVK